MLFLNINCHSKYEELLSDKVNKYVYSPSAPRGRILDRNGKVLVDNVGVKTIYYNKLDKVTTKEEIKIAYELAKLVDIKVRESSLKNFWLVNNNYGDDLITVKEKELFNQRKLSSDDLKRMKYERVNDELLASFDEIDKKAATIYNLMNKGYSYAPKEIVSGISNDVYAKVIESDIKGITGGLKWERIYPYGGILRDVFGSIGSIPKEEMKEYQKLGYSINDIVGISYLEKQYEEYLKGEKDLYQVNKDNTLGVIKKGKSGNDLYLTIDIDLQLELERLMKENILKAKKNKNTRYFNETYSIVSNPSNGEIMAFAGVKLKNRENLEWQNVNTNLINKSYTVGSVVKGASMSVGYKYGVIDINTKVTDSCVKLYNIPVKCSYKKLGRINDVTALAKSSNYYQFMIAIGITNQKYKYNMKLKTTKEDFDKYRNMYNEYGLGTLTNIDLPNEQIGIIGNNYSSDLLLNLSIGQYDTYTPIELIQYINTLGSGGYKRVPMLMKEIKNDEKIILRNSHNIVSEVSIDKVYRERIKEGLKSAAKSGTARGYVESKYEPSGKTGTSETFIDTDNDGRMDTKTISNAFIGYAPVEEPEFSIVVIAPNLYVDQDREYTKYNVSRYISHGISNFYFEKK